MVNDLSYLVVRPCASRHYDKAVVCMPECIRGPADAIKCISLRFCRRWSKSDAKDLTGGLMVVWFRLGLSGNYVKSCQSIRRPETKCLNIKCMSRGQLFFVFSLNSCHHFRVIFITERFDFGCIIRLSTKRQTRSIFSLLFLIYRFVFSLTNRNGGT